MMKKIIGFSCIFVLCLLLHLARAETRHPHDDEYRYLQHAYNLKTHQVFSGQQTAEPKPEAYIGILYPTLLALQMSWDKTFSKTVSCLLEHTNNAEKICPPKYGFLVPMQLLFVSLTLGFVFLTARSLKLGLVYSWLSVGLSLITMEHIYYANRLLTENLILPFFAGLCYGLLRVWQSTEKKWALFSGVMLAFLALTKPSFLYLLFGLVPFWLMLGLCRKRDKKNLCLLIGCFVLAYGISVAPWMIRNKIQTDHFALTHGYGVMNLVQRVSYNRMDTAEYGTAFLYWLPDFGDRLSEKLSLPYHRLNLGAEDGFYRDSQNLRDRLKVQAKEDDKIYGTSYLLKQEILGNFFKHAVVTLPLMWRGLFVANYWSLVTLLFFVPVFVLAIRRRWDDFLILSFPPWFMLGLHAFVSISIPRYNLPMIPLLAIATCWALEQKNHLFFKTNMRHK